MKILKLLLLNFILIAVIICIFEIITFKLWTSPNKNYISSVFHSQSVDEYFTSLYKGDEVSNVVHSSFRKDLNTNSNKKPILFMGCSFTHGTGINENETISYLFAKKTNRPIYNRAGKGFGLDQYLYQFRRGDLYKQMQEPEYIIYTFIYDHFHRFNKFKIVPEDTVFQPRYKIKNNSLVEIKPTIFDYLFSVSYFNYSYTYWFNIENHKKLRLFFTETEKEIHKHWKNSKLVILVYDYDNSSIWEELKNQNFQVIKVSELTDINVNSSKYQVDGCHPSKEVWEILVPKLIKKLNIKLY